MEVATKFQKYVLRKIKRSSTHSSSWRQTFFIINITKLQKPILTIYNYLIELSTYSKTKLNSQQQVVLVNSNN